MSILLIGAGGAAKGVIPSLLSMKEIQLLTLTNRSFTRAQELKKHYSNMGNVNAVALDKLVNIHYDLIINATSASMYDKVPMLSESLITPSVVCYDMFYKNEDTSFVSWARKNGTNRCTDGLGMLISQAAHSFLLWNDILPSVSKTLKKLQSKQKYFI